MSNKKVVLTTFASPIEAQIARTQLEDAEIWCLIADDGVVATDPLLAIAVGGVRLMVFEGDVARATEVLAGPRDGSVLTPEFEDFDDELDSDEDREVIGTKLRCPECGSDHIGFARWVQAYWVVTGVLAAAAMLSPAAPPWDSFQLFASPAVFVLAFVGVWATLLQRVPLACNDCSASGPRSKFQNRL